MKLSSLPLVAFLEVARRRSFSKAARSLSLSQPALSHRIRNLEEELRCQLFVRKKDGVTLSESGARLLRYCQAQEQLEAEYFRDRSRAKNAARGLTGDLRVAGFSSVMRSWALPRLAPILRGHPEVRLEFFVRELGELPRMLRSGEADYVLLDRKLEEHDILSFEVGVEENALVEPAEPALRNGLSGDVYLDHDAEDTMTARYLRLLGSPASSPIRRIFLDDIEGILDGVALGLGRAVVPKHLLKGRSGIRLVRGAPVLRTDVILNTYRRAVRDELWEKVVECLQS